MSESTATGTPTPLLLSAKRWGWKHISGPHAIDLNIEGSVPIGTNTFIDVKAVTFNEAADVDVRIDFGSILKLLFSGSSYPNLGDTEMFSISDILIDKTKGTITVVGNILEKVIT